MSTVVSFPGLGISLNVSRVAFSIGGFEVYWYGILLGLALIVGMLYLMKNCREFGMDSDALVDVILVGTIFGVIGARLYYVFFSAPGEFESLKDILNLRNGGVAFYGAVIGGMGSVIVYSLLHKIKMLPLLDMASIGFLIGQGIGRWGNFVNQEAFGTNTTLPWGMTSDTVVRYLTNHLESLAEKGIEVDPALPVHPTFLYESVCCLIGFILINKYKKNRRFDGEITLMYFAWNGATRALIEGLRTDSLYIGGMRVSQVLGAVCAVLSIIAIVVIRNKIKCSTAPEKFIPYGHTEECKAQLAEIDEKRRLAKCKVGSAESTDENHGKAADCNEDPTSKNSENTGESHDKSNEKTE